MTIELAETNCLLGENFERSKCQVDVNGERHTCSVTIWNQPWIGPPKIQNPHCSENDPILQSINTVGNSSAPIQSMAGDFNPINIHDTLLQDIVSFVINEISSIKSKYFSLEEITSASAQIVGVNRKNYKIELRLAAFEGLDEHCEVEVFNHYGTFIREMNSFYCVPVSPLRLLASSTETAPVDRPVVGGFSSIDIDDDAVKEIASFAVIAISQSSNSGPLTLVKITSASTQVVAGTIYKIGLRLTGSDGMNQNCEVEVFDQFWTSTREMNSFNCVPDSAPRRMLPTLSTTEDSNSATHFAGGSFFNVETNDAIVKEITSFAMTELNKSSNSGPLTLVRITSASKQVVAGANYQISLRIKGSDGAFNCKLEVFDQSWTQTRTLTSFFCIPGIELPSPLVNQTISNITEKSNRNNQVVGGFTPVDTDDEKVKEIAYFAVITISQSSNSGPLILVEITSALTQVVAGTNYKIGLRLVGADGLHQNCQVEIFDQSWTSTREMKSFNCDPVSAPIENLPILAFSPKTGPVDGPVVGGFSSIDIDNEAVKEIAYFAVTKISQSSNSGPLTLVAITSASTQVVAGTNYKISLRLAGADGLHQNCQVEIFDQSWTSTREMKSFNCVPHPAPTQTLPDVGNSPKTTPVDGPVVGGFSSIDINDEAVKDIVSFAVTQISESSNSGPLTLVEITSASAQVVAGTNYKIGLRLTSADGLHQNCQVEIFDQSWTSTREMKTFNCVPHPILKLDVPEISDPVVTRLGGFSAIDTNDENVKEMASFAFTEISQSSNSGPLTLVEITSASAQVVAGKNYKIGLRLAGADGLHQNCQVEIFDQSWTSTREMKSSNCEPDSTPLQTLPNVGNSPKTASVDGPVVGGFSSIDTDDEAVKEMASFAVTEISQSSNSGPLTLMEITSASVQVVAGTNYKIGLRLTSADGLHQNCQVVIFDQSWTSTREMKSLNCDPHPASLQSLPSVEVEQKSDPTDLLLGGFTPIDTDDEAVKEIASFAVTAISQSSNSGPLTLVKITSASTQVVAGTIYKIGLRLTGSDGIDQNCEVEVFDQFWTSTREINSFNCVSDAVPPRMQFRLTRSLNIRNKRGIVGGVTPTLN